MKQFKLFRVACDSSAILNFVEKNENRKTILRATEHTQKIKFDLYNQILIIANMSKTEISAKIIKHKKYKLLLS